MAAIQGLPPSFLDNLKQKMHSTEGIVCFLDELDPSWLFNHPIEQILHELLELTAPFNRSMELILSGGLWVDILSEWLERSFPIEPPSNCLGSVHIAVLQRLVDYMCFEGFITAPEFKSSVQDDRTFVQDALRALQTLAQFDSAPQADIDSKHKSKPSSKKKLSQAERKRDAAKRRRAVEGDDIVFQPLGFTSPNTAVDAHQLSKAVSIQLHELLKKYIGLIRSEAVATGLRQSFQYDFSMVSDTATRLKPHLDKINTDVQVLDSPASALASAQLNNLKAALYFDSAFDFGQWEVVISSRGIRDIRAAYKKNPQFYDIVMKKIEELSNSHFSDDNQKRLNRGEDAVPVFEAKMTGDSRLVYQIDCVPDYNGTQERQVIRIFGVYNHAGLDRLWDSLGFQLARKGKEYRKRCCTRALSRDKTIVVPAVFPLSDREDNDISPVIIPELPQEDLEEIHSILVLEKFVMFSKELRNSIVAELDVNHVFNVSPQEMEIIRHPFSCYVLGRSGTGKTTTMMFKMLGLERAFASYLSDEVPKPRQLFVTQSRVLADRVEQYFAKLLSSLLAGNKSDSELEQLANQQRLQASTVPKKSLVRREDDVRWKAGLPKKFSLLNEEHFPLFLTFERLLELLIMDIIDIVTNLQDDKKSLLPPNFTSSLQLLTSPERFLKYSTFLKEYWAHFPQSLTKGLDPALVFSEIIGVIKGSEQALSCKERYLNRATYLALGERTHFLVASQREAIYDLFLKYMYHKQNLGHYDAADRTRRILEAFKLNMLGVPGTKVDFLYIDEAQDNMLIDAMLLRSICRNPAGLFWAGDTAQTISVGSSFRFEDLKAFMHRLEECREQSSDFQSNYSVQPSSFNLSTNYRSHGGIVSCAHSIVEIITYFWPTSLDKLTPEKGEVNGLKPFFFGSQNEDAIQFEDFLRGGETDEKIELGSEQCILVRDNSAKKRLEAKVGKVGIIMTIYDSKGLEFNDVLLYQFFENSTVDYKRWRVLLNFAGSGNGHPNAPQFNETRHAGLCSELKLLYVAVTRARKKLWIYDGSNKADPLKMLWTSGGLIENFDQGTQGQLPWFAIAEASSCEQWEETGRKMFDASKYSQAVFCFEKAGLDCEMRVAQAHELRKEAEEALALATRKRVFLRAAQSFKNCAQEAVDSDDQRVLMHNTGECFREAGDPAHAAEAYEDAQEYESALQMYREAGMFDEGVQIIKGVDAKGMNTEAVEAFKDVAKLFYFKQQDIEKAKELFQSSEEALIYLEDNDFLSESHALLLEDMGRSTEAAQVHLRGGRVLEAVRALIRDETNTDALIQACDIIIQRMWGLVPFGTTFHDGVIVQATQLLEHASMLTSASLPKSLSDQVKMFLAIRDSNWSLLGVLGNRFLVRQELMPALLCFGHCFQSCNLPPMRQLNNVQISQNLGDFIEFLTILRSRALTLDLEDRHTQQLFGFQRSTTGNMYVPPDTWLHRQLAVLQSNPNDGTKHRGLVTIQHLKMVLHDGLLRYIASCIRHEMIECRTATAFTLCLRFTMTGNCTTESCSHGHVGRSSLTQQWLTAQIRIHLQQILIYQLMESIPQHLRLDGDTGKRRYWISRLYQTLNPPTHAFGSWSSIEFATIPEAEKSLNVVKDWCRNLLYGEPRMRTELELSSIYRAADLCFHLDHKGNPGSYVHRSTLVHRILRQEPSFYRETRPEPGFSTVPDLLESLNASHPGFISAGIRFAHHALHGKLSIDMNVFCHFLEFLCGAIVLAERRFQWHYITLPRSLCAVLLHRVGKILSHCDTSLLRCLMEVMHGILKVLATGGENAKYLLNGNSSMESIAGRRPFIPRICRAMCLVGYNIADPHLRTLTLNLLKPLHAIDNPGHLYARYARAESWKDVVHAIWNSTKNSALDDLVQLWSKDRPAPIQPPPLHVIRIFFDSVQDLPHLLRHSPVSSSPLNDHVATSQVQPVSTHLIPGNGAGQLVDALPLSDETDHPTPVILEATSLEDVNGASDMETLADADIFREDQRSAAEKILKAYQNFLRDRQRQRDTSMTPREAACRSFFEICLKHSKELEWPPESIYKKHYLGVIPHLLVCIQWAQTYASSEKASAKKAFKEAQHIELERVKRRLDRISDISKRIQKLQKAVEPRSYFHTKRDTKELYRVIEEVETLFAELPKAFADEVHFDWTMANRVRENWLRSQKPALNMEDDLDEWNAEQE